MVDIINLCCIHHRHIVILFIGNYNYPDEQLCQHIVDEVKIDLIKSGLVPKAEKSFWQSVKRIV